MSTVVQISKAENTKVLPIEPCPINICTLKYHQSSLGVITSNSYWVVLALQFAHQVVSTCKAGALTHISQQCQITPWGSTSYMTGHMWKRGLSFPEMYKYVEWSQGRTYC